MPRMVRRSRSIPLLRFAPGAARYGGGSDPEPERRCKFDISVVILALLTLSLGPLVQGAAALQDPQLKPSRRVVIGGRSDAGAPLSSIGGARLLSGSRIAVLDRLSHLGMLFDGAGSLLSEFGARGQGPGEWLGPASLATTGPMRLALVSEGLARIHEYVIAGDRIQLESERRLDFLPRSVCGGERRLFVLGERQGYTVHEVDREGAVINSFGAPVERPDRLLGEWDVATYEWTASGFLVCFPRLQVLVHVPQHLASISAYTWDGELVWRNQLPGWSQAGWARDGSGRITAEPDPMTGETSGTVSAVATGDAELLVQFRNFSRTGHPEASGELVSLLVNVEVGVICIAVEQLPEILDVGFGFQAWASDDLFPQVSVGVSSPVTCVDAPGG